MKLNQLDTEKVNQNSLHIDEMSTIDILKTINNEDQKVAFVVQDVILQIAQAVDCIYEKMCLGGRLIYVGAGTSGRLGILDASECPPTYGVEPTLIQGIIAGGIKAVTQAVEGAEDSKQLAQIDLEKINQNIQKIVFVVTIHNAQVKRQTFGMIENSYIRLVDVDSNEKELCRFNLKENGSTATSVLFAELLREGTEWQFKAIGEGKIADLNGILALFN